MIKTGHNTGASGFDPARLLAARMGHEINNVTQALSANLQCLQRHWRQLGPLLGPQSPAAQEEVPQLLEEMDECLERIGGILRAARMADGGEHAEWPVISLTDPVHASLHTVRSTTTVPLHIELPIAWPGVRGDTGQLTQVMINLLMNAVQAVQAAEAPHVIVRGATDDTAGMVSISVEDNGPGLSATVKDRLFQPFVSTRRDRGGSGLGLFISREIVRRHRGEITAGNGEEGGAVFTLCLPTVLEQ